MWTPYQRIIFSEIIYICHMCIWYMVCYDVGLKVESQVGQVVTQRLPADWVQTRIILEFKE